MKRRSTWTTRVLVATFLSLTTTPCSTRLGIFPVLLCLGAGALGRLFLCRFRGGGFFLGRRFGGFLRRFGLCLCRHRTALSQHREDARDVAAHDAKPRGVLQLTAGP